MTTQGVTIQIQAKIEGWQAELKRIQDEAKKINLGSSLGRDLERYLTTLEKQVNTMGKSLTQNFTSDAAIDRFGNKVGDIEERFQHIGQILSSIQLGDLNVEYVSSQLNPLIDQINLLQSQLNNELDVAWGDKITGEAIKVQKAFERIGKSEDDIKNLGREGTRSVLEEMVTSAIKQADEAAEKIKNLQHNIAEFKKAEEDWQPTAFAKETNIDSYVSSIISKDPTSYGFQPIINEQALEETKKKIEDSINEIKLSDAKKADIQKYLNDLVPTSSVELIRKRIDQIKQVLSGVAGRAAFGLDAKSLDGYLNDIFNKIDPSIIDINLNKIKERFISDGITEDDLNKFWGPFSDAIRNQDFDKAIEIVSTNLTNLQEEYKSGKDKIIAARQELEAALKQAQGDQFRAAWTRTFGEDALKELDALIEKYTAASDTAKELNKTQKELNQKTADLVQQPQNTGKDITYESSQRYRQLTSEIQAYKAELADVQAKEQMLGKIQGVAQRWFSIYAAVRMVENAIKNVISTITELDKTITEIAIVTDMGQDELWAQMPQYTALAQQYAASISGVYQVSQLYYQQGLNTVEVMELTEQTLKMARISGLDYAQATDYMTNAIRSFKMEMSDAQSIVDVYSAIAAASATDTTELASAMSKTASSAQAVGSSFEDTTAMMAVMIEATRESAENIGSAMKSIISRYGEMTSDPSKLVDSEGEVMSLNRVDTALQTVGITIHDTEGKFRSFSDVIVELAEKWDTIDTNTQRYIATTMAGNRQQSRFLALVSSGDRLEELMTIADESEDASQLQYLKTLDSITAKTQQLQTSLQTLYTDVGIEQWYKSLLDVANNVLATFNKMPTVFNLPIAAIANFGIQFYNIASIVTTVVSMIKNDLVTQAQQVQGLITEKTREASEEQIKITREKVQAQEQIEQEGAERRANITAGKAVTGTTKTILGKEVSSQTYSKLSLAAKAAGSALSLLTAGMGEATTAGRVTKGVLEGVAGTLTTIGYVMSGNPFMAIVSGVMAAVNAIDTIIETTEERAERLANTAKEANNKRIQSSADYKNLKTELDQIKELEKTYNDSAEAKEEYYEHTNAIAEQYPVLVSAYDTEGNAILDLAKAYELLNGVRGQAEKDAADAAQKAYDNTKNAEEEARKVYIDSTTAAVREQLGVFYGNNTEGLDSGIVSLQDAPRQIQQMAEEEGGVLSLLSIGTKLNQIGEISNIPLLNEFLTDLENFDYVSIYEKISSEDYRKQFESSIATIPTTPAREAIEWVYNQVIDGITEIGGIAAKGDYNAAKSATEAARQTQIAYKTQAQFSSKKLEADFGGGAPADYLDDFSAFGAIVNGYIDTQFQEAVKAAEAAGQQAPEWSDWWKNSSEIDGYYQTILKAGQELWASLSPENQTKLNSLIASRSKYNQTQFENVLIEEFGLEKEDPILTELLKYYTTAFNLDKFNAAITKRQEARGNKQNQLDLLINQYQDILNSLGGDELSQVLGQYDKLETKINAGAISESTGRDILQQYIESFEGQVEEVQALLANLDIFSFTDVMDLIHQLEGEEFKGKGFDVDATIEALTQIAHLIPLNINTEAETLVAQVTTGLSDMESSIKHITKGMDYKTMTEEAQKLGLETKDFVLKNGKYTPSDYVNVVNGMMTDYNNQFEDLITETNKRRSDVVRKISHQSEIASKAVGQPITVSPTANMLGITQEQFELQQENYSKYLDTAGETAKSFVDWYFDSQIQTITDTSGQVKDYLTDVFAREALEGGQLEAFASLAFGEDNWKAMDLKSQTAILDAISTGDISNLTTEQQAALKQYETLIISTYKDIQSSIANAMISAIGNGEGTITVTEANKKALEDLQTEHQEWLSGEIAVGSQVTIAAENLLDNAQTFEQFIISSFDTNADRIKALTDIHKNQYANSRVKNYGKIAGEETFAYEDLLDFISGKYGFEFLNEISIEDKIAELGLAFDSMGNVIIESYDLWIAELESEVELLSLNGANQQELNHAQALLEQTKHAQEQAIASGFDGILKDYSNISTESVENLANALNMSYEQLVGYINEAGEYVEGYLISNGNGTYQLDTSKLPALLSELNDKVSQATIEAIEKSISSIGDTYLSNIKNATSYTTKGASSLADVEAFRQSYADIVHESLNADAFQYDSLTQSFVLDPAAMHKYVDAQKKILTGMGYTEEFVNAYITDQTDKAIQAGIELDSFLNADTSRARNDEANKLIQQISRLSNYREIAAQAGRSLADDIAWRQEMIGKTVAEKQQLTILRVLESGGQAAVDLLKQIKPDASSDELEAAFNSQINKLTDVLSQVSDLVAGEFVGTEGKLYEVLARAGAVDSNGVVESGFEMVKVYAEIYAEMQKTNGKTIAGLNDVYAQMWDATFADNDNIKELMSNAGGMAMDSFKNILSQYEVEIKTVMDNNTRWGIKWDSFGNIIIDDIDAFMQNLASQGKGFTLPQNSYEYQELRKSWADAIVEIRNRPFEIIDSITNEITQLSDAKDEQSFNISTLQQALGKTDGELRGILADYAVTIRNGILTIHDASDVDGIMQTLAAEANEANIILTDDLQEITDAVSNLLQEIANIISNGISGKLSNVEAGKLTDWASERGIDVDYTRTAEGLQLTAESAAQVYEEMKNIDPLLAKSLLPAIKDTKESYSTLTGTLMEFNDYNKQIAHKQDLANFKTLEDNLNENDELEWRKSNSKVKKLYEEVQQAIQLGQGTVETLQSQRTRVISPDGGIMTYHSLSSGVKGGKEVLVTPILPDGTVMSDNWAEEYANKMSAGEIELETKLVDENGKELNYQFKDIFMGAFDDVAAADKAAEAYHEYGAAVFEAAGALTELTAKQQAMQNTLVDLLGNHMLDPDSMNFMSNKLPDYWQGPINMWENASQAMQALTEGSKKGYMGVQDFYNIVTTASSLMEAAGQKFEVAGMNASQLLQKGAENIKVVSGKAQIDLSGAGITVVGGVDELKANMAEGVQEMARAQIAILDAEIAVLEILAAMEEVGDLDVDMDGISFELEDIFEDGNPFGDFTSGMSDWLTSIKSVIDKTDNAKELLQNLKVNGTDMYSLLSANAAQWRAVFGSGENVQKVLKQLMNTDWDLTGDLQTQVMDFINNLDLNGFDTTFTYETPEMTIEFTPGGVKTVDWTAKDTKTILDQIKKQFDGNEAAARKAIQDDIQALSSGKSMQTLTIEQAAQINGRIKVVEGKNVITDSDGKEISVDNTEAYNQALAEFVFEQNGIDPSGAQVVDGKFLTKTVTVGTNTNVTVKTQIGDKNGEVTWEYESKSGIKGTGNTEAEMLDDYWKNFAVKKDLDELDLDSKQQTLWVEFGIRAAIKANITNDKGKVLDPSTDPGLRQQMRDIANTISGEDAQKLIEDGIVKNLDNGNLEVPIGKDGIKITVPGEAIDLDAKGNFDAAKLTEYLQTASGLDTVMAETISAGITKAFKSLSTQIDELDSEPLTEIATAISTIVTAIDNLSKNQGIETLNEELDKLDTETLEEIGTAFETISSNLQTLAASGDWVILTDALTLINTLLTSIDEHSNVFEAIATSLNAFPTDALNAIKDTLMEMADALVNIDAKKQIQIDIQADGLDSILSKLQQIAELLGQLTGANVTVNNNDNGGDNGANTPEFVDPRKFNLPDPSKYGLPSPTPQVEAPSFANGNGLIDPNLVVKIKTEFEQPSNPIEPPAEKVEISTQFKSPENVETVKVPVEAEGEVKAEVDVEWTGEPEQTEFEGNGDIDWTGEPEQTHFEGTGNVAWSGEPNTGPFYADGYITWHSSGGGGGGCFVAGTKIYMADGTTKNIEDIQIGEYIIAYNDEKQSFEPKRVNDAYAHPDTPKLLEISLSNGIILGITPSHPILTTQGWKSRDIANTRYEHEMEVDWLNIGDTVISYVENAKVVSIRNINIPEHYNTYNIEVDECHTYLADGIVVHNAESKMAKGNFGLAHAKGTLMGELGPELVVSNGRYFVAGQNGAEMVDLADDAIVFNHLQTEQLLKKGMSSGRGRAVTNERNAVAFATGNTGPAMASAGAAVAQLKRIRAMWESLLQASVSDLAGSGGGGGGGGGGGDNSKVVDPSIWVDTVERWYNLMQKIAKLEKEITHEETLRSKLQSDWNANGNHYYASQKRSLEALRDQIDAQEQLNLSREAYYDQRVEALQNQPFGKLIEFDNEGQMRFKSGAMEWLTDLAGFDSYGKANYTDEEKYNRLIAAGYGDYMKYDDGGEIKMDEDNDGEVTDEERQSFYSDATKAFWDKIDEYKEATQSLWDSIKEGEDAVLQLQADQNDLLAEIRDNQMEVEDAVLDAIVDIREREIDALQDERDKLEESTQKYIDGLTDALNNERQMYENQEAENSLNQQRRRLAILQRSGGSAQDIANLRSEIDSSERDMYFNLQQQQIDAIQAASDLEIERMDSQIEIMTEALDYQKEYGLLWGNVYEVMEGTAQQITSFITNGNSEFWASSELATQKVINEQLFAAEQWTSYREDLSNARAGIGENGVTAKDIRDNVALMVTMNREQMKHNDYAIFDDAMRAEFGAGYDSSGAYRDLFFSEYDKHGDLTKATATARAKYSADKAAAEAAKKVAEQTAAAAAPASGDSGGGGGGSSGGSSGGGFFGKIGEAVQTSIAKMITGSNDPKEVIKAGLGPLNTHLDWTETATTATHTPTGQTFNKNTTTTTSTPKTSDLVSNYANVSRTPSLIPTTTTTTTTTKTTTTTTTTTKNKNKSGGGCFIAGTKIAMADGSLKNIEQVQLDEVIMAYDEQRQLFVPKRVIKAYPHFNTPRVLDILLSDNTHMGITPGHPILTTEGWKSRDIENSLYEHNTVATWLELGDTIVGLNGNVNVVDIQEMSIPNNYTTYNLEVEECHTYIANGIVVHNAKAHLASGGYADHGIYELGERGTETVLTASQTKVLRDNILSNRPNSLISLLKSYNEGYDGINNSVSGVTPVEDNSTVIEKVELNMEVKQIANDYDARRAGEQALNEMMRIARKTGAANSIRR